MGENESHPLESLMETLGSLIESHEVQHFPRIEGSPLDTLKAHMQDQGLKQSDLSEIGNQGVISEILSGKRQFNARQIKLLSKRFNVSPAVFI